MTYLIPTCRVPTLSEYCWVDHCINRTGRPLKRSFSEPFDCAEHALKPGPVRTESGYKSVASSWTIGSLDGGAQEHSKSAADDVIYCLPAVQRIPAMSPLLAPGLASHLLVPLHLNFAPGTLFEGGNVAFGTTDVPHSWGYSPEIDQSLPRVLLPHGEINSAWCHFWPLPSDGRKPLDVTLLCPDSHGKAGTVHRNISHPQHRMH